MTPITKEEWANFNHKMQWDIITALRGPDIRDSHTMKYYTTGVIRFRMNQITSTHGSVTPDLGVVVLPDPFPHYHEEGLELSWRGRALEPEKAQYPHIAFWSPEHFLQHVAEAAQYLSIPIVWCPMEVWEEAMGLGIVSAGKRMVEGIEEQVKRVEGDKRGHPFFRQRPTQSKAFQELKQHVKMLNGRDM